MARAKKAKTVAARKADLAARGKAKREAAERAQVAANLANDVDDDSPPGPEPTITYEAAPSPALTRMAPRLPDGVDFYDWLEEHGLARLPDSGSFFAVVHAYGDGRGNNDSIEVIESCPAFTMIRDAHIAAHELSRGNMPRLILRCQIIGGSAAHDG